MEFHEDLHGLKNWYALFHTREGKNLTKYNNWNFTTSRWWDSVDEGFWFATNTTILVYTVPYYIGKQQIENAIIRVKPERINFKNQNVTKSLFGISSIPLESQDIIWKRLIWRKTAKINDDHLTDVRTKYNRSSIQSNIDFDFTERIYDVQFYNWGDILSKIGGLRASILPILGYIMPLLTLHFLWSLAGIIDDKMHQNQQNEMYQLLNVSMKQFKLIQNADLRGQIQLSLIHRQKLNALLAVNYDDFIEYKPDGSINHKSSHFDKLESHVIDILNLTYVMQQ